MVLGVISGMASLAHGPEIIGVTVSGFVVKVGDSDDNSTSGNGMGFSISGAAVGIGGTAFAAIARSFADGLTDGFPVLRITRPVFDWHGTDSCILPLLIGVASFS